MRRTLGALAAMLACATSGGCLDRLFGPDDAAGRTVRARSLDRPGPANKSSAPIQGLFVASVILERPIGDPLLDGEVWASRGAPVLHEREVLLAENGLRVRVLGGNVVPAMQAMIDSGAETVNPHGMTFANRSEGVFPTAGPLDACDFQVVRDIGGRRAPVALKGARCGLMVRPERLGDDRVKVYCEPQVQHGERADRLRLTADGTQFTAEKEVPTERFPELGFEVTLGPTEHLVVGNPAAARGTLGSALFTVEAEGRVRQRVLVIRASWNGEKEADPTAKPVDRRARLPIVAEAANW